MAKRLLTTEGIAPPREGAARVLRVVTLVHGEGAIPRAPRAELVEGDRLVIGREPGAGGFAIEHSTVSRRHAAITVGGRPCLARIEDLASRNGTFLDGRKVEGAELLAPGSVLRCGDVLLVYSEAALPPGMPMEPPPPGRSLALEIAEHVALLAAPLREPVLVIGPTGAGKELLAERIHAASGRRGRLVALNCASLSRELIGSELFGHVKGAFSGAASDRGGLFLAADGGTLLLDEIAEMPLDQQPALLRVLQEGKVRKIGSDDEQRVDVRIVAATHQDLEALAAEGRFRPDLFARLAGVQVDLPGLAQRREEILPLFRRFLEGVAAPLTTAAAEALLLHGWPRNVRELKSAAGRVKLFAGAVEVIDLDLLPPELARSAAAIGESEADEMPERETLVALLKTHGGNVAEVGRALDRHRQQVYRWLRRYRLRPEDYRTR